MVCPDLISIATEPMGVCAIISTSFPLLSLKNDKLLSRTLLNLPFKISATIMFSNRDPFKGRFNKVRESNLSFFRDSNGNEVDIIAQTPMGSVAIEIKSGQTIVPDFFRGLDYFERIAAHDLIKKYIVYGGEDKQLRSKAHVLSYKNCHEITEI